MEDLSQLVVPQSSIVSSQDLLKRLEVRFPTAIFRLAPKNPSQVQKKYGNGKRWVVYCEHEKRKEMCTKCAGSSICKHDKRRYDCVVCEGASRCPHKKRRQICVDCNGSGLCKHGTQRQYCRLCDGSGFCAHGKRKSGCFECDGISLCEHMIPRSVCVACNPKASCEHGNLKYRCKPCGTNLCSCGKRFKQRDGLCVGCLRCESVGCTNSVSGSFGYRICYTCGCFKIGRTPQQKRQDKVFTFIEGKYPDCEIRYDQRLPDQNCTKTRPDVLFLLPYRKLIVELDENSHKAVQYSCEAKRMSDLAASGEILPTVFIRLNPDLYRDPSGTKRKIPDEKRFEKLQEEIDRWLDPATIQKNLLTAVYLYYDGCQEREEGFIPFDLSEQGAQSNVLQEDSTYDEENHAKKFKVQ